MRTIPSRTGDVARGLARRGPRERTLEIALAVVVVVTEVVAARAAFQTLTFSTDPSDRTGVAYPLLLTAAGALVVVAVIYAVGLRARVPGALIAVAAVGTAFGLWTWLVTAPLTAVAVILSFARRRQPGRAPGGDPGSPSSAASRG